MNKWIVAAGLIIAAFTNSCSTDFDLNADFKETPVVYALFDASVDTQFIRINRAFLSDEIDALTLSSDPNSIYYGEELKVTVEEYDGGTLVNTYPIPRINGEDYGIEKLPGAFADAPNILYLFVADLDYTHSYKITAIDTLTGKTVFAQAAVVDSFAIIRPDDEGIFPQSFAISPANTYQLRWKSAQDAKIYDLTLRFHYREGIYYPEGDSIHYINSGYKDWIMETNYVAESTTGGLTLDYDVEGETFYQFIEDQFPPVDDFSFIRIADSIQFIIDAGGEELFSYFEYNNASLGITEGQITPAYTNVQGGLGVLSSRYHKVGLIYPVSTQTRDSIACSSVTSGHNFAPNVATFGFPYCE
ncbi:MAG: DUF4249 family protein [Chitinophagales bacterium]|nr:DUF4249 family protein [Bacteroidota bacterium]MBP9221882.1 DUF4249 family protein [Chitinophagales bacterium]MBP9795145.1 DUF4249 family protein [Chitinophagales bacterium]